MEFRHQAQLRHARVFVFASLLACLILSAPAPAASILNDQEQAIANYMINDPSQKRPFLMLDPILAGVARARAQDMATRNYFSHVNPDGVAANYLVRQAGYVLPDWWGTSPTDNFIESIAAGYSTPQKAWDGWMNSTGHRTHILGLDPFYAAETSYGVGYYYDANSTYKYYWVILTAPPMPGPKLAITTPVNGTEFISASLGVAGTSTDSNAASIQVRIENSAGNGSWLSATGTANWSATLAGFAPGANKIRARSVDASGNSIEEVTCDVSCLTTGLLDIELSGSGSVAGAVTGTSSQPIGQKFTITAKPSFGYDFAGWSGDSVSKNATLTFTMTKAVALRANFVANFFPALRGLYTGLIVTGSNDHNGLVRIASGPTGVFSGQFQLDGLTCGIRGQFGADGKATVTLPRLNANPLVLNLQLDFTEGANQITGTISDGVFTASITADRAIFNASTQPAPQAGYYTVALASNPDFPAPQNPQGNGFACLTVAADGSTRIVGVLGDGTPFAQLSMVSQSGAMPVYLPLYSAKGSLAGALNFRATEFSDLDGTLNWTKPPRSWERFYPGGFAMTVPTVGSLYKRPAFGVRVMDFTNGVMALGDGNLASPVAQSLTLSTGNRISVALPNPQKAALGVNTINGCVLGWFVHPADNRFRVIQGVVLQKQKAAFGVFNGVDQSGWISVAAAAQAN